MQKTVLDNGLTIITKEDSTSKLCTLGYIIKSGSYEEEENEKGIAHLLEHMMFKGTTTRDYKQINKEIESIGGYLNAATNFEYTKYYCTIPYSEWEIGLDVLSDMIFNSTMPENELEKEKGVVQEELKMYNDDPSSFVYFKLVEKMFKNYPNRQLLGGTIESVGNITRDDILSFIDRNYYPENMIFLATGNVNHKNIVNFIDTYLNNLHIDFVNYQKNTKTFESNKLNSEIFNFLKKEIGQNHICFGLFGPSYNDKDSYAIDLLTNMLGGNCSSILYNIIREQKGLAYSIHTSYEPLNDAGVIYGYAGLNNKNTDIIEEILKQIESFKENIDEELLEISKTYFTGMLYLQLEKTSGVHNFLSEQLIHNNDDSIESIISNIKNIKLNDILNIVDKYFNKENICFVQLSEGNDNNGK